MKDVYAEAVHIMNRPVPLEKKEIVDAQMGQYHLEEFPRNTGMIEGQILMRRNTPLTRLLGCTWFNEMARYSERDQLSFNYIINKINALPKVKLHPFGKTNDLRCEIGHVFRKNAPSIAFLEVREKEPPTQFDTRTRINVTCPCEL